MGGCVSPAGGGPVRGLGHVPRVGIDLDDGHGPCVMSYTTRSSSSLGVRSSLGVICFAALAPQEGVLCGEADTIKDPFCPFKHCFRA